MLLEFNGFDIPDRLPEEAVKLLAAMECDLIDEDEVDEQWLASMADSPYPGPVREAVISACQQLVAP